MTAKHTTDKKKSQQLAEMLKWEEAEMQRVQNANPNTKVIMLKVPRNDEYTDFAYAFLRYPDRADISIAMTMQNTDPLKGKEIILQNSWIEGDRSIITDTELFLSACTVLDSVIGVRMAIIKKNWLTGQ